MSNASLEEQAFASKDLNDRIKQLEDTLAKSDPMFRTHLVAIHKQTREQEELVHLLSDDQLRIIFASLQKYTGVQLTKEIVTKKTRSKTKPTADDL